MNSTAPARTNSFKPRHLLLFAVLSCAVLGSGQGYAQFGGALGTTFNNPISATASQAILGSMNQRMLQNLTRHQAERTEAPVPLSAAAFTPAAGSVLPARLAGGMTELTPEQRQEARQLLEQLLAAYDDLLIQNQELRLRHNVAGAVMFAVLVSHLVLSGEELSEAQQEGILQGVNAALADTAQFTALGAAGRQELYEALVISANTALALQQDAGENPRSAAAARELAATLFRQVMGHPHDRVAFTPDGPRLR